MSAATGVSSKPADRAVLRPGAHVGALRVVRCEGEVLELKARLGPIVFWLVCAAGLGFIAVFAWIETAREIFGNQPAQLHAPVGAILLPLLSVVFVWLALHHLGLHIEVDGRRRTYARRRLFNAFPQTWDAATLRAVSVSLEQGGKGEIDYCYLHLSEQTGNQALFLTRRRVDKSDCANLIAVASHVGRLMRLPVEVEGDSTKACRRLREALDGIKSPSAAAVPS